MKKTYFVLALLVCASLLLSACGDISYDPVSLAGNPNDPTKIAEAYATGLQSTGTTIFDTVNLQALQPLKTLVDYETGIVIQSFQDPGTLQDALLIFPTSATIAISDGPGIGIGDMVALVTIGLASYYICLYTAKYATEAVGQITAQDWLSWNQYLESHSNRDHNPNISGSQARINIEAFLAAMAAYTTLGGPDPRNKCGVTSDASGNVIRAAVWVAKGYLMWFFINTPGTPLKGPWGGSYDITSDNFDLDRNAQFERDRGWTWTSGVPCDSIPGGVPTFLQAAQP